MPRTDEEKALYPWFDNAGSWPEDQPNENGNYQCMCRTCEEWFHGNKGRRICKSCAFNAAKDGTDVFRAIIRVHVDEMRRLADRLEDHHMDNEAVKLREEVKHIARALSRIKIDG